MLIYICCSGGATSSMLCQRIGEASQKKNVMIGYIYDMLRNMEQYVQDYEIVLACGPVDILLESNFKHTNLKDLLTCILISPQVRFMAPVVKDYFDNLHIPMDVIDMRTFGSMDGNTVWQKIQTMLI